MRFGFALCATFMLSVVFLLTPSSPAQNAPGAAVSDPKAHPVTSGILLMAHGGSKDWNEKVGAVAADVNQQVPTEIAFGMADRSTLQDAVDKLTARGVQRIVAVPLFVSSHSSVIEATKYLLGLRTEAPKELADFAMPMDHHAGPAAHDRSADNASATSTPSPKEPLPVPVHCSVPLLMAPALDHHVIVAQILADRAAAIARNPTHDALLLVAHGPNDDQENALWLADMAALAQQISAHAAYARVEYVTVRDDAEPAVRDQATAELRRHAQAANDAGDHVLVVPLLLSFGGIENGIRQRLDGIEHTFAPQALLPDPRIAQWVLQSARENDSASR
jgi:sirohydrochlorin ferrochelatase